MKKSSSRPGAWRHTLIQKITSVSPDVWRLIVFTTIIKGLLVAAAILAYQFGFYCDDCRLTNGLWNAELPRTLLSSFQTWDGQQYLELADKWYDVQVQRNAFYPLLPAILAIARAITWPLEQLLATPNVFVVTAICVTTALSYAAVIAAYYAFRSFVQRRVAFWATLLLISFPTAYTLHSIYTESLFILLVGGLIIALHKKQHWWAGVCALLLPLTRPQGIVAVLCILLAHAWMTLIRSGWLRAWWDAATGKHNSPQSQAPIQELIMHCAWIAIWSAAGLALYYLNMITFTGNIFGGVEAQAYFGSRFSFQYVLHPFLWIDETFFAVKPHIFHFQHSSISQLLFGYSIIGLYFVARVKETRPFWIFALALIAMSAIPGTLTSYARYAFALLPMYPAFAQWIFNKVRWPRVRIGILSIWILAGILAQCMLYFYHSSNNWIA